MKEARFAQGTRVRKPNGCNCHTDPTNTDDPASWSLNQTNRLGWSVRWQCLSKHSIKKPVHFF
jgi:hypothetical protein